MTDKKFIVMCGLPGTGKSTFVHENFREEGKYTLVCSTDNYIEHVAKLNNKTYDEVFPEVISNATSNLWFDIKKGIDHFDIVIVDQTNLTKKKRKKLLQMVPEGWKKECWHFVCETFELKKRLTERAKTGKTIPNYVLDSMRRSYEPPEKDEGFDCIITKFQGRLMEDNVYK